MSNRHLARIASVLCWVFFLCCHSSAGAAAEAQVSSGEPIPGAVVATPVTKPGDAFGARLFSGAFARDGAALFNPDYIVANGDRLKVRLWGAVDLDSEQVVDAQGNIFLPKVGPVLVAGVRNGDLPGVVEKSIRRVFVSNVQSYVSLADAQPVRVYVTGFVMRPGLYQGRPTDSLLHYLDKAGGIDVDRGSFIEVQLMRGGVVRASVNLYGFLLDGHLAVHQFQDGDVVLVQPRHRIAKVAGLVENANRFEFREDALPLVDAMRLAKPLPTATHVRINRNQGATRRTEYLMLADAAGVMVNDGDEIEFTADKKQGTISVRVEGEHLSAQEYVLPYGSHLRDVLEKIVFSERSQQESIQLLRRSVRERHKEMLGMALNSLEASVLTARSATSDEARLRKDEADLILRWVEKARLIEPTGQVLIANVDPGELLLENGDVLRVPAKDALVLVSGEVLFPTAIAHHRQWKAVDYIRKAGGYAQNADTSRVVVARTDGSYANVGGRGEISPGDEILVLPKVDVKSMQITKDLTQIIYQIAVSAKVILDL